MYDYDSDGILLAVMHHKVQWCGGRMVSRLIDWSGFLAMAATGDIVLCFGALYSRSASLHPGV